MAPPNDTIPPPYSPDDQAATRFARTHVDPKLTKSKSKLSILQRQMLVERMMLDSISPPVIKDMMGQRFGVTKNTVAKDMREIQDRWAEEDLQQRSGYKSAAMRRIADHIAKAKEDRAWGAVGSLERLLSQIQGTLEPLQVNVEFAYKEALVTYVSNLSEEQIDNILERQKELERKALMFDRGIDPYKVIDTEGRAV